MTDFYREFDCTYNDEQYSVRDNGAILRYPRVGKRPRLYDNQWTFGKANNKTGYLEIASVSVHSIIATAFHGLAPTKGHVVDHIDTNKQNNRPENLRWVTKLENILLDPITAKRIARVCGSVEGFLCYPGRFQEKLQEPKLKWIGNMTELDAQITLQSLLALAGIDKVPTDGTLDRWLVNRIEWFNHDNDAIQELPKIVMSKTPNAAHRDWKIPSEFPCCPQGHVEEPIKAYAENLKTGSLFCRNHVYSSLVLKSAISNDSQSLYILSESTGVKPWGLAKITYENDLFVHTSLGTFFKQDGAEKEYCLAQGLEWTGGDTFDDYCS